MESSNGLKLNRLAVLLQIVLIPTYFIIYTILWSSRIKDHLGTFLGSSYKVAFLNISFAWLNIGETGIYWLTTLGVPVFYSLPWVVFSAIRGNKIATTYSLMGRALGRVRLDQKIFYGLNAGFALIFFIFPFLSPAITIIGIFLMVKILLEKIKIGRFHFLIWFVPGLLLSLFPMLLAGAFYLEYSLLFTDVITFWNSSIDILFGFCLCLAISIAFGNFWLFINDIRVDMGTISEVNYGAILFIKLVVLFVTLPFYFFEPTGTIIQIFNYSALIMGVTVIVLRFIKKLESSQGSNYGFILIPVFAVVQIISTRVAKSVVVAIAAGIFILLFIVSYLTSGDEEFILENL